MDRVAICLSGLCLVHCVASVLLLALLASMSGLLLNPLIHEIGLGLAIPLGVFAFTRGLIFHRRKEPILIGSLGLLFMGYALSLPHGVSSEVGLTVLGVLLVAAGHVLNQRATFAAQ